jgi:hypothetical protein
MIHVATVHYKSDRWVDIQLSYLHRNLSEPFRVYANLEGVPGDHDHKYHRVISAYGRHAGKLNLMAAEIAAEARSDDLLMFVDGDAFPVDDPLPAVHAALSETALIAVQRKENGGDLQPHPSFCVISVREWERLHGDWSAGYSWTEGGEDPITDVGGNLLGALERTSSSWTPLLRSNRVNLHPVFFGVYGNVVYHHGAGFRRAIERVDGMRRPTGQLTGGVTRQPSTVPVVGQVLRAAGALRLHTLRGRKAAATEEIGERLFSQLQNDPSFYLQFL